MKQIQFLLLSILITVSLNAVEAKDNRAYRPGIYSLSYRQENSVALGLSGVPAYVVSANRTARGLFITKVQPGGQWQQMGLAPGDVLLSINSRVINTSAQLDQVLSNVTGSTVSISFARNRGGSPVISNTQASYAKNYSALSFASNTPSTNSKTNSASATSAPAVKEEAISSLESHMVKVLNQDRSKNGSVASLFANTALTDLARNYAQYMIDHNYFGHVTPDGRNPTDRARQAGITCAIGENISIGSRGAGDKDMLEYCQRQMMAEPPNQQNHRGNILNPDYSYVGIGVARNNTKIIMVQEFSRNCP